jgi:hypothetical protein
MMFIDVTSLNVGLGAIWKRLRTPILIYMMSLLQLYTSWTLFTKTMKLIDIDGEGLYLPD